MMSCQRCSTLNCDAEVIPCRKFAVSAKAEAASSFPAVVVELEYPHTLAGRRVGLVERYAEPAIDALEDHAVSAVLAEQYLVLRPRPGDLSGGGRADQHAVAMPFDEVRPNEVEPAALP